MAHLEGAILIQTHLEGARLNGASFDKASHLNGAALDGVVLDQVVFDNTNLAVVDWTQVRRLGDERVASTATNRFGGPKDRLQWLRDAEGSVRAYRQLAVALRNQGMIEHADRFAYRARILERRLFARKRQIGQYVFATFLALLAGYGYRPSRSILSYLVVITAFATVYYAIGPTVGVPLPPLGALVFSMTSFHGRGFFPGGSPGHSITLDDPLTVIAACEAVVGLVMEITFFATFTQRLFGK